MGIFSTIFSKSGNNGLSTIIKAGAFLVDVRTASEFSGGSVKGAVNIPLDNIAANLSKFRDKRNIVVFCKSGIRSAQAKAILEQHGFSNITNGGTWHNVQQLVNK